jgi:hypothetical protein
MSGSLAAIVEATCGALARVPVWVSGAWNPEAALSGGWTRREWNGVARAAEPAVALLFASAAGVVEWHKSERPRRREPGRPNVHDVPGGQDVHHGDELDMWVGITAGPGQPLASLAARVRGAHANVTAAVPDSARSATVLGQSAIETGATGQSAIEAGGAGSTGVLFELAVLDGTPRVAFSLLFIAASQVEVVRNGLWRVRPAVAPALHEPLRTILGRRRHGSARLDALRALGS